MAKITHNISSPNDGLGDQLRTGFGNQNLMNTELYDTKVDKVAGKDLTTNDFTNTLKAKLDALAAGAEVNVQSDWAQSNTAADDYIKNKPVEMFSSVGSFHYVDLATKTTPLNVLAGVEKKITNDKADSTTNILNAPYGITSMWNAATNQLDFTQTAVGDLVTIIPAIEITTTVVNQTFSIYIKMGVGSLTPTTKQVYNGALAAIGAVVINATRDFTIDTLDNKNYPAEIYVLSNANATVKSGELDIKVVRKDINVINLPTSAKQFIDFGTIAVANPSSYLNTRSPNVLIQDQNKGQIVIQGTFNGVFHQYLYVGTTGYYGQSGLQSTMNDFLEVNTVAGGTTYDDTALVASVATKVDKVAGKSLILDTEIARLLTLNKTDTQSYALSDTTTNLATGDVHVGYALYNFTLLNYWISVKNAPTISSIIVDLKKSGVSVTSTKAGIDAAEFTSLTGTAPVLTTTTFTKGDLITANIFQVGSGDTGKILQLNLEIIKT